jgi:hypothetical protein
MVRVVEGELLDKRAAAAAYDVARRWLLNNAVHDDTTVDADLYARRAHVAIGSYLDTARDRRERRDIRSGLDLYA